jgi:para-nitrobenzyl esterase
MSFRTTISLLTGVAMAACVSVPTGLAQPVVEAPAGAVRGEALDGVNVFRGIPYAGRLAALAPARRNGQVVRTA